VIFLLLDFAEERLVFQDPVHERPAGVHAAVGTEEDRREDSQGLGIALESAKGTHEPVQGPFAGVAEGRVPDVVREAGCLDEIGVDVVGRGEQRRGLIEPVAKAAPDLGDLNGVGQTGTVKVIFAAEKDLRFILEPAEGRGVNDAVTVHLKRTAVLALPRRRIALDAFAVEDVVKVVFHRTTLASPLPVEKQGLQGNRKSPSG